ncbi:MAG: phosphoribosylglycinamide formyltransferase [Thermodesulfovibrionales bacterium]
MPGEPLSTIAIGVLASGRGSNFQAIIDEVEAGRIAASIAVLISDRSDAYALERARKHGIEPLVLLPKNFSSRDAYFRAVAHELEQRGVGLVVLAGFMRIVGAPLIERYRNRIMNIHPALLPSFPGLHGQKQANDYGVKIAGCTVHFVDEGMDTGPIIIQAAVPVSDDDTEETLSARILKLEHRIFPEAIRLFCEDRLEVIGRRVRVNGANRPDGALVNPPLLI